MTSRRSKIVVSLVGGAGLLAGLFVIGSVAYLYITNRAFDQTIATDLNVSSEWIEIEAQPLLQKRRSVAELTLELPNYRTDRHGPCEIKLSDGRIVRPEIQVIDIDGNAFDLTQLGFNFTPDHDLVVFTPKGGFPDTKYSRVRIRSDEPFIIERMAWRERNPK